LERIIERVGHVSGAIEMIADTTSRQSSAMAEVKRSIQDMDKATQQNAAMVEDTTAATNLMTDEARRLGDAVAAFTVNGASAPVAVAPTPRP
ncbi:hypothetical protein, partial [Campylobacter jejuni]